MVEVDLQRVVTAVADGKPGPGVGQRGIRLRCSGGNVVGARRNGGACQPCGEIGGIGGRTGRRRTDGRERRVGIEANDFVVAMRADVADGQRRIRSDLLLDSQRNKRSASASSGSVELRREPAAPWPAVGAGGLMGSLDTGKRSDAVGRVEGRILVHAIAQRVLQLVVHSESGAHDGLARGRDSRRSRCAARGRNFALLVVKALLAMRGWLEITPSVKV